MSANQILAGIDLGGTTITAGLGDRTGHILLQRSIPTLSENGPEDVLERIAALVKIWRMKLAINLPPLVLVFPAWLILHLAKPCFYQTCILNGGAFVFVKYLKNPWGTRFVF